MDQRPKKARERRILDLVYASRQPVVVECGESPDFLLRLSQDEAPFGVEIVELFHSESQARLDRMPGYTDHLLDGGGVKHKDDRHRLSVEKITLTTETGEVKAKDISAIVEAIPTVAQYAKLLADRIRAKDAIIGFASHTLRHINLIVCDRTRLLVRSEPSEFYGSMCPGSVREALAQSRFREVYFATEFKTGPAVVPLRLLGTVARLYRLNAFSQAVALSWWETRERFLTIFAEYLAHDTVSGVWIHQSGSGLEVLHGDSGVLLEEDGGVCVHMYQDRRFPAAEQVSRGPSQELGAALLERLAAFDAEHTFVSPIVLPVDKEKWRNA